MVTLPQGKTLYALIVLLILIVVNVIVSAFLLITVNSASLPTIEIRVDTVTLATDDAAIAYNLSVDNQNTFEIGLQHLALTINSATRELARIPLQVGTIPAHTRKVFSRQLTVHMNGSTTGPLTVTLTSDIDIGLLVIHKTLPLTVTVLANINDLINQIKIPSILIEPSFGTVTNTSIGLNTTITVTNPNTFAFILQNASLTMTTDTGENVGTMTIAGGNIPAADHAVFHSTGTIKYSALNAHRLTLTLHAIAGATVAGATKTIPINTTIAVAIPSLDTFLPHDRPLELQLGVDLHRVKGGIMGNVNLTVKNPSDIPLYAKDLRIDYFSAYPTAMNFLGSGNLTEHELTPHGNYTFTGQIFFSYASILIPTKPPYHPPPRLYASLSANLTLTGVNAIALWVRLGSFVDLRPFKILPTL